MGRGGRCLDFVPSIWQRLCLFCIRTRHPVKLLDVPKRFRFAIHSLLLNTVSSSLPLYIN